MCSDQAPVHHLELAAERTAVVLALEDGAKHTDAAAPVAADGSQAQLELASGTARAQVVIQRDLNHPRPHDGTEIEQCALARCNWYPATHRAVGGVEPLRAVNDHARQAWSALGFHGHFKRRCIESL